MNSSIAGMDVVVRLEAKVLRALCELNLPDDCISAIQPIADAANVPKEYARTALVSLRDKGMVTYERGFADDGMVAGSGYKLTPQALCIAAGYSEDGIA